MIASAGTAMGAFGAGTVMRATGKDAYINRSSHILIVVASVLDVPQNLTVQLGLRSCILGRSVSIFEIR